MKLTRKQKAFADHLIAHPKDSATKAVRATYNPTTYDTERALASQNLSNPQIQIYLEKHVDKAKDKVIQLIDSDKEEIALRASDSILNRALGMPTQRTENTSVSLNFGMDLGSVEDK
jgi:phage terminase small subunit